MAEYQNILEITYLDELVELVKYLKSFQFDWNRLVTEKESKNLSSSNLETKIDLKTNVKESKIILEIIYQKNVDSYEINK